jgi:hypothetical protein
VEQYASPHIQQVVTSSPSGPSVSLDERMNPV